MRLAAIQMRSGRDREANLQRAAQWLREAAAQGASLALLPENFALMAEDDDMRLRQAEDERDSSVRAFLCAQARWLHMAIIGGSTLLRASAPDKVRNSCMVVDADGCCVAVYDKMHLFDVRLEHADYHESAIVMPGAAPVQAELDGLRIGLSICYDLRFPELYRHYAAQGCNLLSVPAAFTVPTGRAHWETLLRARAIENQCYLLAAGQCGEQPDGRHCWGHSMIVDPWGEVLASRADDEGVVLADISLQRLADVRNRLPALAHRRC